MHIEKSPQQLLGNRLRLEREQRGLTTYDVAERAGFNQSFVHRIETGAHTNPDLAKVAAIAAALGVNVAEALASAGYPLLPDALSPTLYLRAKYRNLPPDQLAALQHEVAQVLARHGIAANDGPAPGEDEVSRSSPSTSPQKGGTS